MKNTITFATALLLCAPAHAFNMNLNPKKFSRSQLAQMALYAFTSIGSFCKLGLQLTSSSRQKINKQLPTPPTNQKEKSGGRWKRVRSEGRQQNNPKYKNKPRYMPAIFNFAVLTAGVIAFSKVYQENKK